MTRAGRRTSMGTSWRPHRAALKSEGDYSITLARSFAQPRLACLLVLIRDFLAGSRFHDGKRLSNNVFADFEDGDLVFVRLVLVPNGQVVVSFVRKEREEAERSKKNRRANSGPDAAAGLLTILEVDHSVIRNHER